MKAEKQPDGRPPKTANPEPITVTSDIADMTSLQPWEKDVVLPVALELLAEVFQEEDGDA